MAEEGNKRLRENIMKRFIILILPIFLFSQDNYQFGSSIRVNDDAAGMHYHATTQRSIGCRGDTVYLVWQDNRYGDQLFRQDRVFFSRSANAGNTWGPNIMISQDLDTLVCGDSHICLDDIGNIYVAYVTQNQNDNDDDIYFVKSTDGGDSFTVPIMVNDSADVRHQKYCSIAVDSSGDNVYVVWQDWRSIEHSIDIYLSRSTDGGVSFLPSVRVNDDDSAYQWYPVIACDETGQYVYVAWEDYRDTLYGENVYFARSTDYGQTFGLNYCVNDTIGTGTTNQRVPSIYYKNNVIYLTWRDERDGYCLYFAKSTDNGLSFGPNVRVVDDPDAYGYNASITANDSGLILIVWQDNRQYSTYGSDIYFAFSSDSGLSFSQNVLVNDHLGVASAWDWNPSICVNQEGQAFVAWSSTRNDPSLTNFDIYVANGTYVGIEETLGRIVLDAIRLDVYPNPFRHALGIRLSALVNEKVDLRIYDISGRLMKVLGYQRLRESGHQVIWDGRDEQGKSVSAGIYFVELVTDGYKEVKKVIKIE